MFQDSLIPNSVIYLPLLKRMTALSGPIRIELEHEMGEPVEVKAPDGVTAKLGVMLELYGLLGDLGRHTVTATIRTDLDIGPALEAQLCEVIKGSLCYGGYDLVLKTKYDDGLILRSVSLGVGSPKPQDKPELLLWLEAWLAQFEMKAERTRADLVRSKALGEMDRKREEARRREEEAERQRKAELEAQKQTESDLETVRAETTDADLADADAAMFEAAWAQLDEATRAEFGPVDVLLQSERDEVIYRAAKAGELRLDMGDGDQGDRAA